MDITYQDKIKIQLKKYIFSTISQKTTVHSNRYQIKLFWSVSSLLHNYYS